MRLRFGFEFDEAGRASGLVSSTGGAASPLSVTFNTNADGGIATSYAALGTAASPFFLPSYGGGGALGAPGTFSGLSAPVSAPESTPESITGANSADGGGGSGRTFEDIGGYGASSGGGINDSSGPGKTARISQYYDAGDARYEFSGNQDIDATLIGSKWTITNLTFSFPTSGSFYQTPYYDSGHLSGQFAFNAQMQNAVRYALGLVAGYTNLTFTEVTETNSTHGNLRYSQTTDASLGSAEGNFPGSDTWDGDIWFGNTNQPFYQTPNIGNWGQATIMHETGHTLGLKHGHQDYTSQDLSGPGYVDGPGPRYGSAALPSSHDGQAWSLMTYRSNPGAPIDFQGDQFNQPQTYMQDDIAALQYLYGANFNYNSGNTTYTFSATTGEMFVNGVSQGDPDGNKVFRTIWDGNGIDTYNLSNFTGNQTINLAPGAWTTFNAAQLANSRAYSGGTALAPGNIANALLYNGDTRSLIENAVGGSGNDSMYGNDANNTFTGGAGNDYMIGWAGNDINYGGDGNDTLDESIAANGGNDTQYGQNGNDSVYGGTGNDYLDGGADDDYVQGNSGNDTLYGNSGNDSLYGSTGDDLYYILDGGDLIVENANEGTDTISTDLTMTIAANVENLSMYYGYTINATGNNLNNVVTANDNNNIIDMRSGGTDTVYGNGGDDAIYSSGYGAYYGGAGNDSLYAAPGLPETLDGGADTDLLDTSSYGGDYSVNLITGVTNYPTESYVNFENLVTGVGNDTLIGTTGDNNMNAGSGNDSLSGDAGNDTLTGGLGNDTIVAGAVSNGTDSVDGGDGDDVITSSGAGTYLGGIGNDYMYAGLGTSETLDGGTGIDTIDTTLWSGDYSINLTTGVTNYPPESYVNFENATTGAGNDTIVGSSAANILAGGTGNDVFTAGAGNDTVYGGDGDDTVNVGSTAQGKDIDDGGAGVDLLNAAARSGGFSIDLATGVTNFAGESFVNFESVIGGAGNDTLLGTADGNSLDGAAGNDSLSGLAGDDTLSGGAGNDTINAGTASDGTDTVDAGDGNDLIVSSGQGNYLGGLGNDTVFAGLTGGIAEVLDGGAGTDMLDTTLYTGSYSLNLETGVTYYSPESFINFEYVTTGVGNDTIVGSSVGNLVFAGDGNDNVDGAAGNDSLNGDAGDDTLFGNDGADAILGGAGDDSLLGGIGDDTMKGGADNDVLNGGTGGDRMSGNAGDDTYLVDDVNDKVFEFTTAGVDDGGHDRVNSTITYTLGAFVEDLYLSGTINGTGNELDNVIVGDANQNVLRGMAGNDLLDEGNGGNDNLYGGAGDDTYILHAKGRVYEDSTPGVDDGGTDIVYSANSFTLGAFIENLTLTDSAVSAYGNNLANVLRGNGFSNKLDGGTGADSMFGGAGDDYYYVDNAGDVASEETVPGTDDGGTDRVTSSVSYILGNFIENLVLTGSAAINGSGNALNNTISGNGGSNRLAGGAGGDILTGGGGSDKFVFAHFGAANGNDHLTDFVSGIDRLVFAAADYGFAVGHHLTTAEYSDTGAPVGTTGQFLYDPGTHQLYWDSNGTTAGGRVAIATFDNAAMPARTDFFFE